MERGPLVPVDGGRAAGRTVSVHVSVLLASILACCVWQQGRRHLRKAGAGGARVENG